MTPVLQQRHYICIARMLRKLYLNQKDMDKATFVYFIGQFTTELEKDNPKFRRDMFIRAVMDGEYI